MTAVRPTTRPASWASRAVLHVHAMAPWWTQIHPPARRRRVRLIGNVAYMPSPIAGYRIRHDGNGSVIEIKPRRAAAMEIARCPDADVARSLLTSVCGDHHRPFLGEIYETAS